MLQIVERAVLRQLLLSYCPLFIFIPIFCPYHNLKNIRAIIMKLHRCISLRRIAVCKHFYSEYCTFLVIFFCLFVYFIFLLDHNSKSIRHHHESSLVGRSQWGEVQCKIIARNLNFILYFELLPWYKWPLLCKKHPSVLPLCVGALGSKQGYVGCQTLLLSPKWTLLPFDIYEGR